MSDILEVLDFNGTHCGDLIAAAYFRQAAAAIRTLRIERDHWRRMCRIEESGARQALLDARRMEAALSAIPLPGRPMEWGDINS